MTCALTRDAKAQLRLRCCCCSSSGCWCLLGVVLLRGRVARSCCCVSILLVMLY